MNQASGYPLLSKIETPLDLRELEEENRQLKRLVSDLSLDKHMLQDVLSKKL